MQYFWEGERDLGQYFVLQRGDSTQKKIKNPWRRIVF